MTRDMDTGSWPDPRGASQQPTQRSLPARRSGGAEGNERLTATTGAVLLVLLAVEGYTILRLGRLLTLHVFLGMLLLGPVTLKAASVLYRFVRYYTGSEPYRRKGPPQPLPRVLGPIIVLLTACVFGSGIMLAVTGPSYTASGEWLTLHELSFVAWFFAMTIHVLTYVRRLPRLLAAEAVASPPQKAKRADPQAPRGTPAGRCKSSAAVAPGWPANRLAPGRPGDRPAHRAPRGQVAVRVSHARWNAGSGMLTRLPTSSRVRYASAE